MYLSLSTDLASGLFKMTCHFMSVLLRTVVYACSPRFIYTA
jgi:hypothetical protein